MSPWIAWLIAIVSTTAFVTLWFWEVRRILNGKKSTVDSAAGQLAAFRRKAESEPLDRELHHVLQRSKSIYQQAVNNYNDALHRPWAYIPAHLMGFRKAPDTLGGGRPDG